MPRARHWIVILTALALANLARGDSRHLIVCGSGGEPEYVERFADWGERLRVALVDRMGHDEANVMLLSDDADGSTSPSRVTLNAFRLAMKRTASDLAEDDEFTLYLIGHGSRLRKVSRFHITGPDLTADELSRLLDASLTKRVTVIVGASSSAGFINALSSPGRVVCAATKSVDEVNATWFMQFIVEALEDGSADQNRDERVSVLEVCRQAAALTAAHYVGEGLIATEHAILDDSGDGLGTRLFDDRLDAPKKKAPGDGALAGRRFLRDYSFPANANRNAVDGYLGLLREVEELKARKSQMDEGAFYAELERLLIEAARSRRVIGK